MKRSLVIASLFGWWTGDAFADQHADLAFQIPDETFTITGARDIEESGWPSEIEPPFKRVSTKH
jgi:hypothetical protein